MMSTNALHCVEILDNVFELVEMIVNCRKRACNLLTDESLFPFCSLYHFGFAYFEHVPIYELCSVPLVIWD